MKIKLVDLEVIVHHETDKAWLVESDTAKEWVPKSRVEVEPQGKSVYPYDAVLTCPESFALEKGLI